jgi:hypothetical protein
MTNSDYVEDREPLNTQNMLEDGFLQALQKTSGKKAAQIKKASVDSQSEPLTAQSNVNREQLLINLYETRDGLRDCFGSVGLNSGVGRSLVKHINVLGSCIENLGGEVDKFNPLDHISGLEVPDLSKNAEKVLDFTKQCYKMGPVEESSVQDDGRTIMITFSGREGQTTYKAIGTISPNEENAWAGNEAVDYIYTPEGGKMSVRALDETGKWVDRSDSFTVYWDLVLNPDAEKDEKKEESKEEVKAETQNKLAKQENDINSDFPIVEDTEKS